MNQEKQVLSKEQGIINRRNALAAMGVIGAAGVGSNAHAVISTTDVTSKYESSGAEDTVDGVGIIMIGLAIGISIIGLIIGLVKKK